MCEMSIWPLRKTLLKPIYTSATNQRLSLRRDVQAYAVPDVHLSKHLTERQFNADRSAVIGLLEPLPPYVRLWALLYRLMLHLI